MPKPVRLISTAPRAHRDCRSTRRTRLNGVVEYRFIPDGVRLGDAPLVRVSPMMTSTRPTAISGPVDVSGRLPAGCPVLGLGRTRGQYRRQGRRCARRWRNRGRGRESLSWSWSWSWWSSGGGWRRTDLRDRSGRRCSSSSCCRAESSVANTVVLQSTPVVDVIVLPVIVPPLRRSSIWMPNCVEFVMVLPTHRRPAWLSRTPTPRLPDRVARDRWASGRVRR